MTAAATASQQQQVVLGALEVLRLMIERVECGCEVEMGDIDCVMRFLKDLTSPVGHPQVAQLFQELDACLKKNGCSGEFVSASRRFTTQVGDLIYNGDPAGTSPSAATGRNRELRMTLHRLELKYISPHCI